jgi:hypothetical protein
MVSLADSILFWPEPTLADMYFPLAMDCQRRRFQPEGRARKGKSVRLGHCGAGGQDLDRRIGATHRAKARHACSLTGGNHLRPSRKTTAPGR